LAAEALVLIYPVWNEGFPAILKGFFDRVFIPGMSFTIGPDGASVPNPQKLRKLAAVCTYGANRTTTFLLGDPPKRVVKRLVRAMPGRAVRCDYLAYYDMDHSTAEKRTAFLEKVKRAFEKLIAERKRRLARLIGATIQGNKKGGAHGPLDPALAAWRANSHHHNHRSSLSLTPARPLNSLFDPRRFSCPTQR
jgi:multimeric flavodoxin WrbA